MVINSLGRLATAVALGGGLLLAAPGTASASVPVVFELTGTFTEGVLVSYTGANDEPEVANNVGLPWSTAFDYDGSSRLLTFSGIHAGGDPGSVTCRLSVGGRQVVTQTNNAPRSAGTGAVCHYVTGR
ncbi:MmpS family transport accessory protein [Mycobacterium branderi]|uniref:Membrane protein, MmpS n=1 Tax=Mycobacterium branderi TaxID=43348 RepID=A0A7I7W4X4_9MYCO|nr:MmpS family transport accessory protein [Mycobacterium branderi]MCV7236170.1 hypothetical protein [Mycobacterium branderi]ORA32051.1 hypothetical protein BST20_25825 [Mycobacterium branderi]BBZ10798.1 hypothetical protein MBRA_09930 [Mycobacterium branderi]